MKSSLRRVVGLTMVVFLAGCASGPSTSSGFLGDYSKLKETRDAAGETVLRYVNPNLKRGSYRAVMLDPIQFYPAPEPTEQVSAQVLTQIAEYMNKGLREKLVEKKVNVVNEPGPGVLRMRPAITAVASQKAALKPYQYLPIAFVLTPRGQEATIQIETEVVDSVTGERLGASVRRGSGAELKNARAQLTLKDMQPLLDKWIEVGVSYLVERMS